MHELPGDQHKLQRPHRHQNRSEKTTALFEVLHIRGGDLNRRDDAQNGGNTKILLVVIVECGTVVFAGNRVDVGRSRTHEKSFSS